jgi:hypothetical protein
MIGAKAVADTLNGSAQGAQLALVNGFACGTVYVYCLWQVYVATFFISNEK